VTMARGSRQHHDESGILSAFVAVIAVALLVIVGLGVDTGRAIAAQRLAVDEAEQAARAGASQLSTQALRQGRVSLDDPAAQRAAVDFTLSGGHPGTATVADGVVTVRVEVVVPTVILGIVDVRSITVVGTARASDVHGVTSSG
jgi:Flp pilus assembly protein TadG